MIRIAINQADFIKSNHKPFSAGFKGNIASRKSGLRCFQNVAGKSKGVSDAAGGSSASSWS